MAEIQLKDGDRATVREGVVVIAPEDVEVEVVRRDNKVAVGLNAADDRDTTVIARSGPAEDDPEVGRVAVYESGFAEALTIPKGGSIAFEVEFADSKVWQR